MAATTSGGKVTRIMVAINQSRSVGYPHPSTSCRKAFEWTLENIVRANASGFEILLLHVVEGIGLADSSVMAWPQGVTSKDEIYMFAGIRLLEYFANQCREIEVAFEATVKLGDPGKVIRAEMKRMKPDILVVGCSRPIPSFFQKIYKRTLSGYCVKHANCPVFVFKRSSSETPENTHGSPSETPENTHDA